MKHMKAYIAGALSGIAIIAVIAATSHTSADLEIATPLRWLRFNSRADDPSLSQTFNLRTGIAPTFATWQMKDTSQPYHLDELDMADSLFKVGIATSITTSYSVSLYARFGYQAPGSGQSGIVWKAPILLDSLKRLGSAWATPTGLHTIYPGSITSADSMTTGRSIWFYWRADVYHNAGCNVVQLLVYKDTANCAVSATGTYALTVIRRKEL